MDKIGWKCKSQIAERLHTADRVEAGSMGETTTGREEGGCSDTRTNFWRCVAMPWQRVRAQPSKAEGGVMISVVEAGMGGGKRLNSASVVMVGVGVGLNSI